MIPSQAPVMEYISPCWLCSKRQRQSWSSHLLQHQAPVVEYVAPVPAAIPSPAPVVDFISLVPVVFKRQRQLRSLLHPCQQCFKHQRQWWSISHLRQQCFVRQQTFQLVLELRFMLEVCKALSQDRVPQLIVEMGKRRCLWSHWCSGGWQGAVPGPCPQDSPAALHLPGNRLTASSQVRPSSFTGRPNILVLVPSGPGDESLPKLCYEVGLHHHVILWHWVGVLVVLSCTESPERPNV